MPALSEPEYTADVVLRDGSTLHLRPVRPDDDVKLLDMLRQMSSEALYYRFMTVPRIDLVKAAQLTQADFEHQYVLAGECGGADRRDRRLLRRRILAHVRGGRLRGRRRVAGARDWHAAPRVSR